MKSLLSKISVFCVIAASVLTAHAMLPVNVSNEFWCTWSYVNPVPSEGVAEIEGDAVLRGSSVASSDLDEITVRGTTWNFSQELLRFNSRPPAGLLLIIR